MAVKLYICVFVLINCVKFQMSVGRSTKTIREYSQVYSLHQNTVCVCVFVHVCVCVCVHMSVHVCVCACVCVKVTR